MTLAVAAALCQAQERHNVPIPKFTATEFSQPDAPTNLTGHIPSYPKNAYAPAYLGNGVVGIRPGPNPLLQAKTMAAGFVYSYPEGGFETMAPAPYPLGTDIRAVGTSLLQQPDRVTVRSQTLDMASGELTTEMTFALANGTPLSIEIMQFASRTVPSLVCQEIQITAPEDLSIEVDPRILREGVPATVYRDQVPTPRVHVDQVLGLKSDRDSKVGIALLIPPEPGLVRKEAGVFTFNLKKRAASRFRTIAAIVTTAYHPDPDLQAIRVASWGGMLGFDELRQRNRNEWADLWQSRVKVYGDEQAQRALDVAFFYLHSSAHPASLTGVPPFGMSQFLDYYGHIFWDMDHWIMPAVLPASPAAAKAMLMYRLKGLDAAKAKAASFGFRGAMYPWEAGIDGSEVTPSQAETAWAQMHVIPDVALGFWEYAIATGDKAFLREATWPVLSSVADWIESRSIRTARGFEILNVLGPTETSYNVNNSAHMSILGKMVLSAAVQCAKTLGISAPPVWEHLSAELYIPIDKERGVIIPHDGAKPDPKSADYPLGTVQYAFFHDPPISLDLLKRTYEYEETLRPLLAVTQANPCTPRSPGFFCPPVASCAALFGDRKKAADMFRFSATQFMLPPFGINREYSWYRDGNYLMNQASLLMAAMYGFTGLRISGDDWRKYPASLPEGWTRIEIDRMWIKGEPFKMIAEHGRPSTLLPINVRSKGGNP